MTPDHRFPRLRALIARRRAAAIVTDIPGIMITDEDRVRALEAFLAKVRLADRTERNDRPINLSSDDQRRVNELTALIARVAARQAGEAGALKA